MSVGVFPETDVGLIGLPAGLTAWPASLTSLIALHAADPLFGAAQECCPWTRLCGEGAAVAAGAATATVPMETPCETVSR